MNKPTFLQRFFSHSRYELLWMFLAVIVSLLIVVWLTTIVPMGWLTVIFLATGVFITFILQSARTRTRDSLDLLRSQIATSSAFSQEITSYLDISGLLWEIAKLIHTQYQYDYVCLMLVGEGNAVSNLAKVGHVHRHEPTQVGTRLLPETAIGAATMQRKAICFNGGIAEQANVRSALLPGMRSELAVPLLIGNKFLGVLHLQTDSNKGFDADHILVLKSLAAQTAVTIRNANLYTREASRRRLAETLYDIGVALSGTLDDREKVLALILERLVDIVPYDRAALLLDHTTDLEIVASQGFPENMKPLQIRIPLDTADRDDIYVQIHRTQKPLVVPNVSRLANWTHVEDLPQARSWLGVPLIQGEDVIGMLSLVREVNDAYSSEDISPATTFAVQAALALGNANLYQEIARFNTQLEYEIQQRTEAVMQLARLDQAKSDFINIAAHELRTPLTTIKAYSQMMLEDDEIKENETFLQMTNGIYQGAIRLHDVINDLLDVARIENETLTFYAQPISLHELMLRIQKNIEKPITERKLKLEIDDFSHLPEVKADIDALKTVFSHIVMNAIKYTPDGGNISISGEQKEDEDGRSMVEIVIRDSGIGIEPNELELIFTKFYQVGKVQTHSSGKTKFKGGGPGLGLPIARGIVEAHQGRVWAESEGHDEQNCHGSQFHIVLPIEQKDNPDFIALP